jgi:hypothetical protein
MIKFLGGKIKRREICEKAEDERREKMKKEKHAMSANTSTAEELNQSVTSSRDSDILDEGPSTSTTSQPISSRTGTA